MTVDKLQTSVAIARLDLSNKPQLPIGRIIREGDDKPSKKKRFLPVRLFIGIARSIGDSHKSLGLWLFKYDAFWVSFLTLISLGLIPAAIMIHAIFQTIPLSIIIAMVLVPQIPIAVYLAVGFIFIFLNIIHYFGITLPINIYKYIVARVPKE